MSARRDRKRRPPQATVDLLGLLSDARLPSCGAVRVTPHAVERFVERVAPDLAFEDARRELIRLKRSGHVVRDRPWWVRGRCDEETVAYVLLRAAVPLALPVVVGRFDGGYWAVTCLVGGSGGSVG